MHIEDARVLEICQDGALLKNPFEEVAKTHQCEVSRINGVCHGEGMTR